MLLGYVFGRGNSTCSKIYSGILSDRSLLPQSREHCAMERNLARRCTNSLSRNIKVERQAKLNCALQMTLTIVWP